MTQVIGAITKDYVLVAADRRLTFLDGAHKGEPKDHDTCKVVSLCNLAGISYTGLAELQGIPTHEWIAIRLSEKKCQDPGVAAQLLAEAASHALRGVCVALEQSFLIAGWGLLKDGATLGSHFRLVTNVFDSNGRRLHAPGSEFQGFVRSLKEPENLAVHVVGQPLRPNRGRQLDRFLKRLVKHEIGPKEGMRALVDEVVYTARNGMNVGEKVLCFCIPRAAAEQTLRTGSTMMIAKEPDLHCAAFCYFDPAYSELRQYGPTFICGQSAMTDVQTENDPARDFQSSRMRILRLPTKT